MNLKGLLPVENKGSSGNKAGVMHGKGGVQGEGQKTESGIKNLLPGQTIQGEIIEKNGRDVQIMIDKNIVFTARLESDIQLLLGQNLTFEVKSNTNAQISLRPLFENMTQNPNALKALEAAKLPVTNELMRMVISMMDLGMPIDKKTLQDMNRIMMTNPDTSVELLVSMKGFGIEINPENIQQFENYNNYNHQIVNEMNDILNDLPKMLETVAQKDNIQNTGDIFRQLVELFLERETNVFDRMDPQDKTQASNGSMIIIEETMKQFGKEAVTGTVTALPITDPSHLAQSDNKEGLTLLKDGNSTLPMPLIMEEVQPEGKNSLHFVLNEGERSNLFKQLIQAGFPENIANIVKDGSIDVAKLLQQIVVLLKESGNGDNGSAMTRLLAGKEMGVLLKYQAMNQWLMTPEAVAHKENVEQLYEKLRGQTAKLAEIANQAGKDIPLSKSVSTLHNNINFMNQINQVFQYVQLPLRMSGQNAQGELFVYRRKNNAMKEEGSVSALLHLELDHLGNVSVYVTMKEQNVNTKFYLQDESMIDFIALNIHKLDGRLKEKGYHFSNEMVLNEDEKKVNLVNEMMQNESKNTIMSKYSFDVRA